MADDREVEMPCPNGALRGPCYGWWHCPTCGPDMWLRIWSQVASSPHREA